MLSTGKRSNGVFSIVWSLVSSPEEFYFNIFDINMVYMLRDEDFRKICSQE